MTTAREAFEAKKLAQKYGVVGKVAGSYRTAGFEVIVKSVSEDAPFNFIARKKGEKFIVKVYSRTGRIPREALESIAKASEEEGGKPILVLYGAGPRIDSELLSLAKEKNILIRRFRS